MHTICSNVTFGGTTLFENNSAETSNGGENVRTLYAAFANFLNRRGRQLGRVAGYRYIVSIILEWIEMTPPAGVVSLSRIRLF